MTGILLGKACVITGAGRGIGAATANWRRTCPCRSASGWGRENGFDGVEAYLQTKSVFAEL